MGWVVVLVVYLEWLLFRRSFVWAFHSCRYKVLLSCVMISVQIHIILLRISILSVTKRWKMTSVLVSRLTFTLTLPHLLQLYKLGSMLTIRLHYYLFLHKSFLLKRRRREFSLLQRINFLLWQINSFIHDFRRNFRGFELLTGSFFASRTLEPHFFKQPDQLFELKMSPCHWINEFVIHILLSKLAFVVV